MREPLPKFRFHTDPPAPHVLKDSSLPCAACGEIRGVSVTSHYGPVSHECICPWCVADGTAAAKLDASFVQHIEDPVEEALRDELNLRNPGYESWQGESWLAHCGIPCVFHGDLPPAEVLALPADAEAAFLAENDWLDDWDDLKLAYSENRAHPALYKFVCGDCGFVRIGIDFT